jgi:hypothetical protein
MHRLSSRDRAVFIAEPAIGFNVREMHIDIDQPIFPLIATECNVPQMMHLAWRGFWQRHGIS